MVAKSHRDNKEQQYLEFDYDNLFEGNSRGRNLTEDNRDREKYKSTVR
jgi:hypothetical protein